MAGEMNLQIIVVYSPRLREVREVALRVESGSTVLQALHASGLFQLFPALDQPSVAVGVWGRKVSLNQTLQDRDRVEIYRPLRVDPKAARRQRFAKQGARAAGLFVSKRAGAKAGY